MTKLFKRFIAYAIDMFVIILITQSLSGVSVINKQLDTYNKYYDQYMDLFESYGGFKTDLVNGFEDKKLSEKEYLSLIEKHEDYQNLLIERYEDQKLTEKEYDKINKEIDENYQKKYKKIYYKIEQNSVAYFIIYLITSVAYFIGFNKLTGGQTLGKKLMRLKIVSSKEGEDVPVWSYLVRLIILYQPISYLVRLIGTGTLAMDEYYTVTTIFSDIQYYLQILIVITILLRLDGRGIHDLLAKTRVVVLDRQGNEIKEPISAYVEEKLGEKKLKSNKKKIIDEPSE